MGLDEDTILMHDLLLYLIYSTSGSCITLYNKHTLTKEPLPLNISELVV